MGNSDRNDMTINLVLNEAHQLIEHGEYEKALTSLKPKSDEEKQNILVQNSIVKCCILLKDLDNALIHHTIAKSIEKNNPYTLLNEARILILKGNVAAAIDLSKEIIRRDASNHEGLLLLGSCLRANGDIEASLSYLDQALTLKPNYAEALVQKGVIELSRSNKQLALAYFEKSFGIKPTIRQIWDPLLSLLVEKKDFKVAAAAILKMLEVDPSQSKKANQLIACNQQIEKPEITVDSFVKACELRPFDFSLHASLGFTFKKLNKPEKACESFEKALAVDSSKYELHNEIGLLHLRTNNRQKSIDSFNKAIALKQDYSEAHNNVGNAYFKLGDVASAITAYLEAIHYKPDYANAFSNLGIAYSDRNFSRRNLSASTEAFQKAIEINPENASYHNNLGISLKEAKDWINAEEAYRKAIDLDPNLPETYNNLGTVLKEQQKLESAISAFEKALTLNPKFVDAAYNIATVLYIKEDYAKSLQALKIIVENYDKSTDYSQKAFPFDLIQKRLEENGEYNSSRHFADHRAKEFPLVFDHEVDAEFIEALKATKSRKLEQTSDTRFGVGTCSPDFQLFKSADPTIKKAGERLISAMERQLTAKIVFHESFFNIYGAGGGTTPHSHLSLQDADFDIGRQKYSLVYYLNVGDQSKMEPGILKLYEPNYEILPYNGMALIMPASRLHAAVYDGDVDRIMVGANFYIA